MSLTSAVRFGVPVKGQKALGIDLSLELLLLLARRSHGGYNGHAFKGR